MIKNTYADCKIKDINVTGSTAYVTLVIYSTRPAEDQRQFKFFITDETTNLVSDINTINPVLLSNNTYWIDRANNYENLTTNVDINMYKEITLEVDITRQNQGEIRDNRWVRECQIIMMDTSDHGNDIAWISSVLTLISTPIVLPQIKDLSFISDRDWKLSVEFKYQYETQQDFNYQNKNIYTVISTISNNTRLIQESITVNEANIKNGLVRVTFERPYNDYVRINLSIKNNKDVGMYTLEKLYKPQRRLENTYVKRNGVVQRVNYLYFKGEDSVRVSSPSYKN